MRKAAQFTGAALIAAVLMTGCGNGGKDGGDAKKNDAAPSAGSGSQQQSQAPAADGGADAAALQGSWAKGGFLTKDLVILAVAGDHASVSAAPKVACSGKVVTTAKPVTLDLKCLDGGTEYAKGTVKSVDARSITIAWASGKEDVLKKDTEAGKPAGLPKTGG